MGKVRYRIVRPAGSDAVYVQEKRWLTQYVRQWFAPGATLKRNFGTEAAAQEYIDARIRKDAQPRRVGPWQP